MDQNKHAPNDALPTNTTQPNTPQLDTLYDAIIVGGGPAGLTAGIYLARARYRVLIVEKKQFGGQITITNEVVNYPGVERISGRHSPILCAVKQNLLAPSLCWQK